MKKINLYALSLVLAANTSLMHAEIGRLLEVVKDPGVTTKITIKTIKGESTTEHVLTDGPYQVPKDVQCITISLAGINQSQEIVATDLCEKNDYRIRIISLALEENAIDFNVEPIPSNENTSIKDGNSDEDCNNDKQNQVATKIGCTDAFYSLSKIIKKNTSAITSNLYDFATSLYTQVPCITELEKKKEE